MFDVIADEVSIVSTSDFMAVAVDSIAPVSDNMLAVVTWVVSNATIVAKHFA